MILVVVNLWLIIISSLLFIVKDQQTLRGCIFSVLNNHAKLKVNFMIFNQCEPTNFNINSDISKQAMNICTDECEDIVCCDKCGKQLCQLEESQSSPIIRKQCVNLGYYSFTDETICTKCYKTRWQRAQPFNNSQSIFSN